MKFFGGIFFLSFLFYPSLSFGEEDPPATGPEQCQAQVKGLEGEKTKAQEEYNEDCDSGNSSTAKCINLRQRIRELNSKISSQSQQCQGQALDIQKRKIEDANAKVKKHNRNTKMLGLASGAIGAAVLKKGFSCCHSKCGKTCPLIPIGIAGIAMGIKLFNKTKELDNVVDDITDTTTTCVGENCTPPPPPPGATPPPGVVGTTQLDALNTLPELPPFANCEPSCPCPGDPEKLPPNCQIVNDKDGTKVTYGEDKDKDGFGDEQITAADAGKYKNNPGVQAAVAAAKAPYADMLAELEEDMEEDEELLAAADEGAAAGEGFLSGGATASGRSAASSSGSSRGRRRIKSGDDVNKAVQGLMAQFMNKKKKKAAPKAESKLLGKSQIGVARDNIFHMVHRRYQERRGESEFFEGRGGGPPLTHNIPQ